MKYTLEVSFVIDDLDDEPGERIEMIRHEVEDVISNYTETCEPQVKIWEG